MIILITSILTFATFFFLAFLCNQQVQFLVLTLRLFTTIYDILTYPIYFFIDKPWKIKRHSQTYYADRHYEPEGDYYYWKAKPEVSAFKCDESNRVENLLANIKHLSEFLPIALENYETDQCLGRRKVLRKLIEKGRNKFELSDYEWLTYGEVIAKIESFTKVLHHKFKFKRGDRVAIMADTSLEWFVTFFSLQVLGCEVVTLHSTLGESGITYILNSTKVDYLFTQTDLVRLMNKIKSSVNTVTKLINIKNPYVPSLSEEEKKDLKYELYEFDELFKESENLPKPDLNNNTQFSSDDVAIIMFTSGSTGNPKGVLITHNNILQSARGVVERIQVSFNLNNSDTFLAYLPMSHIFEMMCELTFFVSGIKMAFGRAGTLTTGAPLLARGCKGDVQTSQVTIWTGVPLIFERVQSRIQQLLVNKSAYVAGIYNFAYEYKKRWSARGFKCNLIDAIFFKYIQNQFGGKLKLVVAGGAPLMLETQIFIKLYLNVQLILGYSSTECTANGAVSAFDNFDHANTAALMEGVTCRLDSWEEGGYSVHDQPNPRGEIILGTKAASIGYFENPEETEKAFFEQNGVRFWRTGDIGEINKYGHLSIIDRKKDLVKLQMGEYIALGKAEAVLKNCLYVENIVLHGNSFHNHLIAIIEPNKEMISKLAESMEIEFNDVNKLYENEKIKKVVSDELIKYGKSNGLLSKEVPYVIKLCSEQWTAANGLLTASLKARRPQIYAHYKDEIENMYKELDSKFSRS